MLWIPWNVHLGFQVALVDLFRYFLSQIGWWQLLLLQSAPIADDAVLESVLLLSNWYVVLLIAMNANPQQRKCSVEASSKVVVHLRVFSMQPFCRLQSLQEDNRIKHNNAPCAWVIKVIAIPCVCKNLLVLFNTYSHRYEHAHLHIHSSIQSMRTHVFTQYIQLVSIKKTYPPGNYITYPTLGKGKSSSNVPC